ncbi:MAG: T9SS type A sorting domain-containing protein [Candidatus Eisenbacteria bacterium]|jgi:hypothetical protein|nr:T9SS type A sorting domain-containing protein [Candidatus Eisenbacteria bacterium]
MRLVVLAALCVAAPSVTLAYSGNPPNGKTGAPGEGTCHDCHASFGLNSGPGTVTIAAPDAFEAGMTYPIVITIEQTGQSRWGFEFTPLTIGTCGLIEPTTVQIETQGGKTYVKQTAAGTYAGVMDQAGWTFNWTAPAQPPDLVTFYAAANAANGNGSTSGDYIYTASIQIPLAQSVHDGTPLPGHALLSSSPNPMRGRTLITFRVPQTGMVNLGIYDLAGSLVTRLVNGTHHAGTCTVSWDAAAAGVPAGAYLCRLATDGVTESRRLVILE